MKIPVSNTRGNEKKPKWKKKKDWKNYDERNENMK